MSGDLDLALRIRADLDQARAELRRLRAETGQAGAGARTAGRGYEQAASGIARSATAARSAATAQERLTRATRAGAAAGTAHRQAMSASRASLINVGYQVQDVAVQMASGTSASRALSQQLPQLLSGFGLLGVVLGTASAVLIPLAGHLFGTGEAGEEAADATDRLADATDRLRGLKDLRGDLDAIREQYGGVTAQVLALIEAQKELERRSAARAARQAVEGILSGTFAAGALDRTAASARAAGAEAAMQFAEAFRQHLVRAGDVDAFVKEYNAALNPLSPTAAIETPRDVLDRFGFSDIAAGAEAAGVSVEAVAEAFRALFGNYDQAQEALERFLTLAKAGFEKLAEETGLGVDAVRKVGAALEGLRDADGIRAQQEAATRLRQALRAAAAAAPDLTEDQQAQIDHLLGDVLDLEGHLRELLATDGRNPGLDTMAGQAHALAEAAARARAELEALPGMQAAALLRAQIRNRTVGQPVERARQLAEADAAALRVTGLGGRVNDPMDVFGDGMVTAAGEAGAEIARLDRATAEAEAALRKLQRGGGGRGNPLDQLEGQLERYIRSAQRARVELMGLGDAEEARALAALDAARLGEAAIAKIGAGPDEVADIRALQAALVDAAGAAARLNKELQHGPQGAAALSRAFEDYAEDASHAGDEIAEATTAAMKGMEDALVGFVTTGKLEFSGLVDAILADLARIVIRQSITGPLADALSGVFGGIFGGAGPATSPRPTARPWHVGGVVTDDTLPSLYHSGGVAGARALTRAREIVTASARHGPSSREVPALLTAGEAVLTAPQAAAIEAALAALERPRYHAGGVAIDPATIPKIYAPADPTISASAAVPGQDIADRLAASLTPLMERLAGAQGGPRQLRVHIDNQGSGPPQRPREAVIEPDIEGAVVRIITEDDATGGPISQTVSRRFGKRRGDFW